MKNKIGLITLGLVAVLVFINIFLISEVSKLNTKINNVSSAVKNVDQDITCGQTLVNGPTGNSCIGLKDQLNDIQGKLH